MRPGDEVKEWMENMGWSRMGDEGGWRWRSLEEVMLDDAKARVRRDIRMKKAGTGGAEGTVILDGQGAAGRDGGDLPKVLDVLRGWYEDTRLEISGAF